MKSKAKFLNECMAHTLKSKNLSNNTFEEAGLRVFERYEYNSQAVFSAIGKGGYILPIIKGGVLGADNDDMIFCAIMSVNNVKKELVLYNPVVDEETTVSMPDFLEAWTASGADCIAAFPADRATYIPQICDLSHIELPTDMSAICEELAENVHDAWATERQSEGWTYGPKRDDHTLQTPDMVPYGQLPETEKQYDRIMATNTIKFLLSHGYKIVKE